MNSPMSECKKKHEECIVPVIFETYITEDYGV
jgi:hypothetical protein